MSEFSAPQETADLSSNRVSTGLRIGLVVLSLLAVMPLVTDLVGGDYLQSLVMKAMILAIAAISLDLLIGHGGMVSFGHAAFLGVGSYITGIALEENITGALPILAMVLISCSALALITGAISLRTSGVYFIMITLAFGQMIFFSLSSLSYYGGDDGLTLWETPNLFGYQIFQNGSGLFYSILLTLILTWAFVWRLSQSRFGRVLRAGKQNPDRVGTLGFDLYRHRLAAYVIAGVLAGLAGFLSACHTEFISPTTAAWQNSGNLIIMVVLGGMGSRNGALLGALFVVLVEEALSLVTYDWRLIFGPLLILIVLLTNGGLVGLLNRVRSGT